MSNKNVKILITFFTDINTKIQILKIKYTLFLTNPVPKDNSNDECFEDYLYAVLKDIQINLNEIARSIKKISGDDKKPTSILDIDVEV